MRVQNKHGVNLQIKTLENDMWPFKKSGKDFTFQAKAAAVVLITETRDSTAHLLKSLVGEERFESSEELVVPLVAELLAFGLHLTDRMAFGRLGESNRAEFMDALLLAVRSELQPPVSSQLRDLYNSRNSFYGGFRKFYPEGNETLKGTLFWEFGKALGSIYANSNPVAITEASKFGMTFMQAISQEFERVKVFP